MKGKEINKLLHEIREKLAAERPKKRPTAEEMARASREAAARFGLKVVSAPARQKRE